MSVVACDLNTLVQAQRGYTSFSQRDNQAAIVFFLEQRRAKLAGVTPLTANQLLASTKCLGCFPTDPVADAIDTAVAQAGAVAAGVAGASTITPAQVRQAIVLLRTMSLDDLRTIEVATRCALNAFP